MHPSQAAARGAGPSPAPPPRRLTVAAAAQGTPPVPADARSRCGALDRPPQPAGPAAGLLELAAELAVTLVDGCDAAGLLAVHHGRRIAAASRPVVLELGELQVAIAEGPCFEAMTSGGAIGSPDLGEDGRWPWFGPEAVRAGFRSALAIRLSDEPVITLTVYARAPAAFGAIDRRTGGILAALGGLAVNIAGVRAAGRLRVANLYEALRTRELIGQAQGILIERHHLTGDEAFEVLRRASQHRNVKLIEVARTLVETGETPPSGTSRDR